MVVLELIAGFALLAAGGEFLVRAAVEIASRLGVPPLLVGFTIVAAATSAPELVVGVQAALAGTPTIVLGNVSGANIANLGLGLGAMALIRPFTAERGSLVRDVQLLLLAILGFVVLGLTVGFTWWAAAGALVLLVVHLWRSYRWQSTTMGDAEARGVATACVPERDTCWSMRTALLVLAASVTALVVGADWLLEAAIAMARTWGVSDTVVGASVVALGTTLPETATATIAALRGRPSVALGNLVGSCLFNLLGVLGVTALVAPFRPDPAFVVYSGITMLVVTLLASPVLTGRGRATRGMAFLLLGVYALYIVLIAVL